MTCGTDYPAVDLPHIDSRNPCGYKQPTFVFMAPQPAVCLFRRHLRREHAVCRTSAVAQAIYDRREASVVQQHWYLKNCRLLERLPANELQNLESDCKSRRLATGEVIYLPLDRADAVLALISGQVKLCHVTPDGKESILAFIEPGEIFGELCLLDTTDREELAISTQVSTIVLIPRNVMQELMGRHAELALGLTRLLGLRRLRIERRLKSLLFRSNRDRLLQLLLELVTDYAKNTPTGLEIRIKLSHQDVASLIGSTRETVTTALGELQTEGIVKLGRQRITICSKERLIQAIGQSIS
jgi:CRP/FNR family cyclic AMP-dependent transcriptional regulator